MEISLYQNQGKNVMGVSERTHLVSEFLCTELNFRVCYLSCVQQQLKRQPSGILEVEATLTQI